jgi:hypothetical protein
MSATPGAPGPWADPAVADALQQLAGTMPTGRIAEVRAVDLSQRGDRTHQQARPFPAAR